MVLRGVVVAAFLALAGCQTVAPPNTPSGKPEATIKAPVGKVKSLIISRGMNAGFNVTRDTDYMLQMEKPTQNIAASVLLGSRYDGIPNERLVFNFAQIGSEVRVVGSAMFVTNPGSAFERITPLNAGPAVEEIQTVLIGIRYEAEEDGAAATAGVDQPKTGKKTKKNQS